MASRPSDRYPSPHSNPCACMPFTSSKALGKLRIVTHCGIGGAPLTEVSKLRSTPSHSLDTNLRTSPHPARRLAPDGAAVPLFWRKMKEPNFYAAGDLDRIGHRRKDRAWVEARLAHPTS